MARKEEPFHKEFIPNISNIMTVSADVFQLVANMNMGMAKTHIWLDKEFRFTTTTTTTKTNINKYIQPHFKKSFVNVTLFKRINGKDNVILFFEDQKERNINFFYPFSHNILLDKQNILLFTSVTF